MKRYAWLVVLYLALIGWVSFFGRFFRLGLDIQFVLVTLIAAPVTEELFFRWLPLQIGKKFGLVDSAGLLANFFFISGHTAYFQFFPWHMACLIQGVVGWGCWLALKRYGLWAAIALHSAYNLFCLIAD